MNSAFRITTITLLIIVLFIPHILFADNSALIMPEVLIEAEKITPTTGMVIIDAEKIKRTPLRNGSVNELIGNIPGIQFNEDAINSFNQGEIASPLVSISGSRYYDNNYTLDGVSNNSPLDPANNSTRDNNKLPGSPQIHSLNPQIIDQIIVYNSNIPAEFGGFAGGQIDTTTIDPADEAWGKIRYRTTRSSWTRFHIVDEKKEEFHDSNSDRYQPEFEKHETGLILSTPLGQDSGLVFSYQRLYSKIPLISLGEKVDISRLSENLFLKLTHYLPDNSKLTLTALASPTESEYFLTDFKNGNHTIENNNYSLIIQYDKDISVGELSINLGYTDQQTERRSLSSSRVIWLPRENLREGGLGSLETGQNEYNLQAGLTFNEYSFGETGHKIKMGIQAAYSRQYYKRPDNAFYYYAPVAEDSPACEPGDIGCIDNQAYLSRRTLYSRADTTATVFDSAIYLQDVISWKRIELFPGLRLSYDDMTTETNLAPRLSASLDLFGNRQTILFAGRNRYYSGTLLTYALYESNRIINQTRESADSDWTSSMNYRFADKKVQTPYTDEKTLGIIQQIFTGEFKALYTIRTSKNELARETSKDESGLTLYHFNNSGRSRHEGLQVSWQKHWSKQQFELNATWQKTTTSNLDYDILLSESKLQQTIWYEGKERLYHEIPRQDFNRPFIANLIYSCQLPYDITFTNVTKYRGAYWRLEKTSEQKPSILNPDQVRDPYIYTRAKLKRTLVFNWHLSWKIPSPVKQNVTLTLDLLNVFNKKNQIHDSHLNYKHEVGRQIWAGLEFTF